MLLSCQWSSLSIKRACHCSPGWGQRRRCIGGRRAHYIAPTFKCAPYSTLQDNPPDLKAVADAAAPHKGPEEEGSAAAAGGAAAAAAAAKPAAAAAGGKKAAAKAAAAAPKAAAPKKAAPRGDDVHAITDSVIQKVRAGPAGCWLAGGEVGGGRAGRMLWGRLRGGPRCAAQRLSGIWPALAS